MDKIIQELKEIKILLLLHKKILTLDEFCTYSGISKSHAYHLTSSGKVKCYKPFGKVIYFDIDDIVEFLKSNPLGDEQLKNKKIEKYFIHHLKQSL